MIEKKLEFDKTLKSLAGNKFGQIEFNRQIQKVEYNENYIIEFPSSIESIATSFIQGFFQAFVETLGIAGIEKKVEIKSSNPKLANLKQLVIRCLI